MTEELFCYDGRTVRVTDPDGCAVTGEAEHFSADYGLHEYGRDEEGLQVGEYVFFAGDIEEIELLPSFEELSAALPPGRYRHDDSRSRADLGVCRVLGIARHSVTGEPLVVCIDEAGDLTASPGSEWLDGGTLLCEKAD
ncbi:MAG: hypothetical protein IK083_10220 [Abditibacteriota bacterium]|nr:hypothetical protein [Abditibacteriota bacterium]